MYLISAPRFFFNEVAILVSFFEAGLDCFHLRKPTEAFCVSFLEQLPLEYHQRVVLHEHFNLLCCFPKLRGFHLKESQRIGIENKQRAFLLDWQEKGHTLSTSFHQLTSLEQDSTINYDYAFLSPIFDSISKRGYKAKHFDLSSFKKNFPLIALGGITPEKVEISRQMGFDDVAVLGAIWCANDPLHAFKAFYQ